jgi:alcohol dehydrogenase class IV
MDTDLCYDFVAPRRIAFGWGRRREVGALAKTLGRRAFLVCGRFQAADERLIGELRGSLGTSGVELVALAVLAHEPEIGDVDQASEQIRTIGCGDGDFVLALGGGAAIDLAKAVAAMATNRQGDSIGDYLENIGRGLTLDAPPLPVLAMPTTAGTGAEATRNAVISSNDPPVKKSLRDDRIMPAIALVDPELTVTTPPSVTAASGTDAITQLIESYVSRKARPIARALAEQGLALAVPAIVEAVEHGQSRRAREAMAHAALLSGMALANAGLGMAHGVAAALGTLCHAAHGAACAVMLPAAIRANQETCREEFARLERLVFGGASLATEIKRLCDRVGVPRRLGQIGVTRGQIPAIVAGSRGSSMSGNPRELSDDELTAILEGLL